MLIYWFFIFWNISFANRYGPHSLNYGAGWATACDHNSSNTRACVQIGSSPTTWGTSCPSGPKSVSPTWTMTCFYWDGQAPSNLSVTYTGWRTNSARIITVKAKDAWGSKLKKVILQQSENWGSWGSVKTWDNINSNNFSATWTRTVSNWNNFKYKIIVYDNALNNSYKINSNEIKFDTTPPTSSDITVTPSQSSELLATNSKNFTITVGRNWGSPITKIVYQFEKYNSVNDLWSEVTVNTGYVNTYFNISNVDNDRRSDWSREYTLKIDEVCDEAWNCTSNIATYHYYVYANTPVWYEITNFSDFSNTYIWNNQNTFSGWILLKDQYWNKVVPAPWINRKITIKVNYDNSVYLDQYHNTWTWGIKIKFKNNSLFNILTIWPNKNKGITYNNNINNWYYWFNIKSYVPTLAWYNKAYWNIKLNTFSYEISQNSFWTWGNSFSIDKVLKFKPQISLTLTGVDFKALAAEWTYKKFTIHTKVNSSNYSAYTLWFKFTTANPKIKTYLSYNNNTSWKTGSIYVKWKDDLSSNFKDIKNDVADLNKFSLLNKKNIYEKYILLSGWHLNDDTDKRVLSSHIILKYNDGTIAIYNSDLIWKNNYNTSSNFSTSISPVYVYVLWLIWGSDLRKKIYNVYSGNKTLYVWNISKYKLRNRINKIISRDFRIKNKYDCSYGIKTQNILWNVITPNLNYRGTKIYYYDWKWRNNNLVINGETWIWGKYLIIVNNANVFITWNVQTNNKWMVWLIVLSSPTSSNWNIYINNNITNLDMYIYTDKAVITYKWNPSSSFVTQESLTQNDLKNQLLIKWVLWSFNTLGASINSKCPYFDRDCSNPKKYDLFSMRKFRLISTSTINPLSWDNNNYIPWGTLIGWIKCTLTTNASNKLVSDCKNKNSNLGDLKTIDKVFLGVGKFTKSNILKYQDFLSPVIIYYDPRIKEEYLPVFSNM